MSLRLFCYEVQIVGIFAVLIPIAVPLGFVALAVLAASQGAGDAYASKVLMVGLEVGLPFMVALSTVSLLTQEPTIELQQTLAVPYRQTALRRYLVVLGWSALVAVVLSSAYAILQRWATPQPFLVSQLAWLSPMLAFSALGAVLALVFRSRGVAAMIVSVVWIFELLFQFTLTDASRPWLRALDLFVTTYTPNADFWLTNRLELLGIAVVLGMASWALLYRSETLTTGGEA